MKLSAAQFFQPCQLPTPGKRPALVTAARDDEWDMTLEGSMIRVTHKTQPEGTPTYVTIYNTCWIIPQELKHESRTSQSDSKGTSKAKVKPNTVAKLELPPAD